MATGNYSVAHPTSGTAGEVRLGEVPSPQAWADLMATTNALGQTLSGGANAKTFKGLHIDGTGGAAATVTARTIYVTGGALAIDATSGVTLNGMVSLTSSTLGTISGEQIFEKRFSGATEVRRIVQAAIQTLDATATTIYSLGMPTNGAVFVTTRVVGLKSDYSNAASYMTGAAFRSSGGAVSAVGTTQDIQTPQEDDAAWGTPAWSIAGQSIVLKVTGKAATTIDWMADLVILITY